MRIWTGIQQFLLCCAVMIPTLAGQPEFGGVYPHLAHFNDGRECGTGAVVPWAERLWVITYSPHRPEGSSDKLYEINAELSRVIRPESVGGTPASRMIHVESNQLFLGPYAIDSKRNIRVIPPAIMPGRLTGKARHLIEPANKIYVATMEEGFYEVDVRDLTVKELYPDANKPGPNQTSGGLLPGYHGKGLYSGQGRLVYANNGEYSDLAMTNPEIPSGVLASWDGTAWTVVRRNQFTEVTGPGGLYGNLRPGDPIWSIGWDHRSLILMLLDDGRWYSFRLPKASHCYDGAHGWNTEWPRIRDIGEEDMLMTMHGMFWRFPRGFSHRDSGGIRPRSTYLKVIGDFCRWNDRLVFGCDDAARSEFLNQRKAKGNLAGPAQSQSNLWFLEPEQVDQLGVPIGRGAVWLKDWVKAAVPSDPFLFDGFKHRSVHLAHEADSSVTFRFELDREGNGRWEKFREVSVPPRGYRFIGFPEPTQGTWVRIYSDRDCRATAWFEFRNPDPRTASPGDRFNGLARARSEGEAIGALLRAGNEVTGLQLLACRLDRSKDSREPKYYQLNPDLKLQPVDSTEIREWMLENVSIPHEVLRLDGNSILYVDEAGKRFRLPVGNPFYLERPQLLNSQRADREVCTERDLFQVAGTFFELPAKNAGGFSKIRPVATHPFFIHDYCSWRGMLVLSGISPEASQHNSRVLTSDDGYCAVWLGTVDELWSLGKAVGSGGPWHRSAVRRMEPSDPYLMAGYDEKDLELSHDSPDQVTFEIQIDIAGTGYWRTYMQIDVPAGETKIYKFPSSFSAYWIRLQSSSDCIATARLNYQ